MTGRQQELIMKTAEYVHKIRTIISEKSIRFTWFKQVDQTIAMICFAVILTVFVFETCQI